MLDDLPGIEALQRSGRHPPRREGNRIVGPATELQSAVAGMLVGAEALVAAGPAGGAPRCGGRRPMSH